MNDVKSRLVIEKLQFNQYTTRNYVNGTNNWPNCA